MAAQQARFIFVNLGKRTIRDYNGNPVPNVSMADITQVYTRLVQRT
jgi:hypothetical protein